MKKEIKKLKKQLKKSFVQKEGYEIIKHLADGYVSSVFLAQKEQKAYALKIMYPTWIPRLTYKLFFQEEHAYFDDNAVNASFYKRKIANRISRGFNSDIEVVDAIEQSKEFKGFYMSFINSKRPETPEEKFYALEKAIKLKNFFDEIGMPTWSIKTKSSDNFRLDGRKLQVIDYESGIIAFTDNGFGLDPINFDKVGAHTRENKQSLLDCLGDEEFKVMEESLEKCKHYTELWHSGEKRTLQKIMSKKELKKTAEELVNEEILSEEEAKKNGSDSLTNYVLSNLGVHFAISCVTTSIPVPFPTGWIPRGVWTIGNRIYQEIRGDKEKAKVHSLGVLAWSTLVWIPMINGFGYLLPLKKINETNALVYGEHITRVMKGRTLVDYLSGKGRFTRWLVEKAIIPKNKRSFYETRKNER